MGTCLQVEDDVRGILDHPGIEENSCSTPSIFTAVMAAPSIELEQRRDATRSYGRTPPRSKRLRGKRPYFSVSDSSSDARRFGFLKPLPHRVLPSAESPGLKPNTMPVRRLVGLAALFENLTSIQLDDELLVDRRRLHVIALRIATTLALNCSRCCSSQGTAFWLCATLRASSTMAFWCIFP